MAFAAGSYVATNYERRRAVMMALNIYNAIFKAFSGQAALTDTDQANLTTFASLVALCTSRGSTTSEIAQMDRYAEQMPAIWNTLYNDLDDAETDIAASNTIAAYQEVLQDLAEAAGMVETDVPANFQSGITRMY